MRDGRRQVGYSGGTPFPIATGKFERNVYHQPEDSSPEADALIEEEPAYQAARAAEVRSRIKAAEEEERKVEKRRDDMERGPDLFDYLPSDGPLRPLPDRPGFFKLVPPTTPDPTLEQADDVIVSLLGFDVRRSLGRV